MSFTPVRVSTLRGDVKISFDLYVLINQKHIHYIKKGDSFEGERLEKLRQKKLKKLYIKPEDENNYRGYVEQSLDEAYTKKDKDIHTRVEVVQGAQQANTEELMENPEQEKNYVAAKMGADKYVDFLLNEDGALKSLVSIANVDSNLAQHGVTVSGLAIQLAKTMGINDMKQLNLLALGAFIHDYGHTMEALDIARPIEKMSPAELEIYRKHPKTGAEKVKDLRHFDQVVIQVIHEHEEVINGTGFPQGLQESKISTEAMIVGVANAFDRAMSFEGRSASDAIKHLTISKLGLYPLDHINGLKSVLKTQGIL